MTKRKLYSTVAAGFIIGWAIRDFTGPPTFHWTWVTTLTLLLPVAVVSVLWPWRSR